MMEGQPRYIKMPRPLWIKDSNGKYVEIPYQLMRGCIGPVKNESFYYIDPADSKEAKDFALQHPRLFTHIFPGWLRLRTTKQSWLAYHLTSRRVWLLPIALAILNALFAVFNVINLAWKLYR